MGTEVVTKRDLGDTEDDLSFFATKIYSADFYDQKDKNFSTGVDLVFFDGYRATSIDFFAEGEAEYEVVYEKINGMRNDLSVLMDELTNKYMNFQIDKSGGKDEVEEDPQIQIKFEEE